MATAAHTTMTTLTGAPPMLGMGTARGRIMVTRIGMGADPTMAMAPILSRIMAVAHILIPTLWVLAPFFPPFWALSFLATKVRIRRTHAVGGLTDWCTVGTQTFCLTPPYAQPKLPSLPHSYS